MSRLMPGAFALLVLLFSSSCDFDVEKIVEIEGNPSGGGDGQLTWYRTGQVVSPAPPASVTPSDDVRLGYIIIFRPGASGTVPDRIQYRLRGCTDETLPDLIGQEELVYVPAPPPPAIIPEKHCVFDSISCSPLLIELPGDYYYAVIIRNVGTLPEGSHDFCMTIDPDDLVTPEDQIGNVKTRGLTVNVASKVFAASLQTLD